MKQGIIISSALQKHKYLTNIRKLSLVIASDSSCNLGFYAFGLIPIAIIPLIKLQLNIGGNKAKMEICNCVVHSDEALIVSKFDNRTIIFSLSMQLFHSKASSIYKLSKKLVQIDEIITTIENLIEQCNTQWKNCIKQFRNKIELLLGINHDSINIKISKILKRLVERGQIDLAYSQEICGENFDPKIYIKVQDTIKNMISNCAEIINSKQFTLFEILSLRISELLGMSLNKGVYKILGLNNNEIENLQATVINLRVRTEVLLNHLCNSSLNITNLFDFLIDEVGKQSNKNSAEESKIVQNRPQFDREMLVEFLKNDENLFCENINREFSSMSEINVPSGSFGSSIYEKFIKEPSKCRQKTNKKLNEKPVETIKDILEKVKVIMSTILSLPEMTISLLFKEEILFCFENYKYLALSDYNSIGTANPFLITFYGKSSTLKKDIIISLWIKNREVKLAAFLGIENSEIIDGTISKNKDLCVVYRKEGIFYFRESKVYYL